jgi:hypothetical protein
MENRWAEPEGYTQGPPPVRYRIRDDSGEVVERETSVAYDHGRQRYYHALGAKDQHFADAIVTLIQAACAYFHAAESEYEPLEGVPEIRITDDDVAARIERLEGGENTREAERTRMTYYPLTDLPFEQQRALVEQIEALKQRWQFEILGEVVAAAAS